MLHKIGIDLGGTKTEIIVLDETLNVLERKRVPTPKDNYEKMNCNCNQFYQLTYYCHNYNFYGI